MTGAMLNIEARERPGAPHMVEVRATADGLSIQIVLDRRTWQPAALASALSALSLSLQGMPPEEITGMLREIAESARHALDGLPEAGPVCGNCGGIGRIQDAECETCHGTGKGVLQ